MKNIIQIKIDTEKCLGCGSCWCMNNAFAEQDDGKSFATNYGIVLQDEYENTLKDIVENCPAQAIMFRRLSLAQGEATVANIAKCIQGTLVDYKFAKPEYWDYRFTGSSFQDIDGNGFYGYSSYDYSSYERAQDAGLREMKRVVFNNMDTIAKRVLIEYKHENMRTFLNYEKEVGNYYYDEIVKVEAWILGICKELENFGFYVDEELYKINSVPDLGYNGKKFDEIYHIEEYMCTRIQDDVESPSYYETSIDWDDYDIYNSKGNRTKTKYAYSCNSALREVMSDLDSGAKSELRDWFEEVFTGYEFQQVVEPIVKEIHEKGHQLLELIGMSDVREAGVNTLDVIDPLGKFAMQCFELESNSITDQLYNCNITEELVYSDECNKVPIEIWSNDYMDRKMIEKPENIAGYQHVSKTDIIYRIRLKDESDRDYWLNLRTGEKKDITEYTKCDQDYSSVSIINDKIAVYVSNGMFYIYDLNLRLIISGSAPHINSLFRGSCFYNVEDVFYLILDESFIGRDKISVFKIDLKKRTTEKILYNEGAFCVYNNALYYSIENKASSGMRDSYSIMQLNFQNGNSRELEKIAYDKSVGSAHADLFAISGDELEIDGDSIVYENCLLKKRTYRIKI